MPLLIPGRSRITRASATITFSAGGSGSRSSTGSAGFASSGFVVVVRRARGLGVSVVVIGVASWWVRCHGGSVVLVEDLVRAARCFAHGQFVGVDRRPVDPDVGVRR